MSRISPVRRSRVYPLFLLLLLVHVLSPTMAIQAQSGSLEAKNDRISIRIGASSADVLASEFLSNDVTSPNKEWVLIQEPQHGSLVQQEDGYTFHPDSDFWGLGLDSMMYSLVGPNGETSTATIHFYIKDVLELVYEEKFEDNGYQEHLLATGTATFENSWSAPITDLGSLKVTVEGEGEAYLQIPPGDIEDGGGSESNSDSGETSGLIDDFDDLGDLDEIEGVRIVLVKLGAEGFGPVSVAAQLVYTWDGLRRLVTAEVWDDYLGGFLPTTPVELVSATPEVKMTWYRNEDKVGVLVDADGQTEGPIEGFNPLSILDHVRVGVMPEESVSQTSFGFDNVRVWRQTSVSRLDVLPTRVVENFEDAQFDDASLIIGTGVSVTPEAAITGGFGLKVDLGSGDSYVRSVWDSADDQIAARFRVDVSDLVVGSGEMFTLFATGTNPVNFSGPSLRLYLKQVGGTTQVAAHVYKNDGVPMNLSWTDVPDSFEVLLRLCASRSDASGNGYLQLWLDDIPYEIFHVPNGSRLLQWSQFGAQGVDPFTSGFLRFDDLMLWP